MKVVHVSFVRKMEIADPEAWLRHLDFFTGIVDQMAVNHTVYSVHCINWSGVIKRGNAAYHFFRIRAWDLLFPNHVHKFVRDLSPDAVVVHGFHFPWQVWCLRALLRKTRAVLFIQHHAERPLNYHKHYLQVMMDRHIKGYFFASHELASGWVHKGQIRDTSKVTEVMEASSPFRPPSDTRSGSKYIWVGRLDENKDPITLLKGFIKFLTHAPSSTLTVIFAGGHLLPETESVIKQASAASGNILMQGPVPHHELPRWLGEADFIISTSHYEGSGVAVCEAMSCGCIPILSHIPSFRMMTRRGEVGLLFAPGDADDLARILLRSTRMDILAEREKTLRQFRSELSFEAISKKMLDAITTAR